MFYKRVTQPCTWYRGFWHPKVSPEILIGRRKHAHWCPGEFCLSLAKMIPKLHPRGKCEDRGGGKCPMRIRAKLQGKRGDQLPTRHMRRMYLQGV